MSKLFWSRIKYDSENVDWTAFDDKGFKIGIVEKNPERWEAIFLRWKGDEPIKNPEFGHGLVKTFNSLIESKKWIEQVYDDERIRLENAELIEPEKNLRMINNFIENDEVF